MRRTRNGEQGRGVTNFFSIATFVWVILQSKLFECLFNFGLIGILSNSQDFVKLVVVDRSSRSSTTTTTTWLATSKLLERISSKEHRSLEVRKTEVFR